MGNKTLCTILGLTLTLGMGITSMAAPVAVEGGGVFDTEYYAQNNADVVAEAGNDFNALWQHYTLFGVNEGRLPFAIGTDWEYIQANGPFQSLTNSHTVSITTTEKVTVEDTNTTTSTEVSTAVTEYAQAGVAYPITLIYSDWRYLGQVGDSEYDASIAASIANYFDGSVDGYLDEYYDEDDEHFIKIYNVINTSLMYTDDVNNIASAVSGYEWRVGTIQFNTDFDTIYSSDWWYDRSIDGSSNWEKVSLDNVVKYFTGSWEAYDGYYYQGNNNIKAAKKFDLVGADGSVETGYVVCVENDDYSNDTIKYSFYYMVPTDFVGDVTLTIYGTKVENNEIVENKNDSCTFVVK